MSPHATDTCDPALLRACLARARELGVPFTIHLAQSPDEVATIQARHGCSPAEYLDRAGVLVPGTLAAHCVACSDSDLDLMAARVGIGLSCRLCDRADCRSRAFPPLEHRLRLDPNEDSASPFKFEARGSPGKS